MNDKKNPVYSGTIDKKKQKKNSLLRHERQIKAKKKSLLRHKNLFLL